MKVQEAIRSALEVVGQELGLTFTLGYIGNCGAGASAYPDYRSWMVWIDGFRLRSGCCCCSGSHRTADLGALLVEIEAGAIQRKLDTGVIGYVRESDGAKIVFRRAAGQC